MPHLTGLLILNTSTTEIPDNAFRTLFGIQNNLLVVYIENNKINKIGGLQTDRPIEADILSLNKCFCFSTIWIFKPSIGISYLVYK